MAADVVGYSRLIELDEHGTLASLKERRRGILEPLVREHHGRIVKVMGDGVLVEFASAVNAVTCAVELQKGMIAANQGRADDRHIVLRIGINLGDVVVEGGDLFGDGVIVAVRLQTIAGPGDICISGSVYDQVKRKLDFSFDELGPQEIKNIAEPVTVYRIDASSIPEHHGPAEKAPLTLPAKPSIAVLPFTNMSNDPERGLCTGAEVWRRWRMGRFLNRNQATLARFAGHFCPPRGCGFWAAPPLMPASSPGRGRRPPVADCSRSRQARTASGWSPG